MKKFIALALVTARHHVCRLARNGSFMTRRTTFSQIIATAQEHREVRRDDQQPGAADSNAHRPAQRVQTLRRPVRRSEGGLALDGPAARSTICGRRNSARRSPRSKARSTQARPCSTTRTACSTASARRSPRPTATTVTRRQAPYLPVAAVQKTTDNYLVRLHRRDGTPRRVERRKSPRPPTRSRRATTDAEVQKLTGVLIGLSSALNNTDYEINQATASAARAGHRQPQRRATPGRGEEGTAARRVHRGRAEIRADVPPDERAHGVPDP